MRETETYEHWQIKQVLPGAGWQVVNHNETGAHWTEPLFWLAWAERYQRAVRTGHVIYRSGPVIWNIVGLSYDTVQGPLIVNGLSHFCGLLPPGKTLEEYMEQPPCEIDIPQAHP